MKDIKILYNFKNEEIKEKINNDLMWYDDVKKEMLYFKGSKLSFKYVEDDYLVKKGLKNTFRMLPFVEEVYNKIYKKVSDKDDVLNFVNNYYNYNNYYLNIMGEDKEGLNIEIEDSGVEDFSYELERLGFSYV